MEDFKQQLKRLRGYRDYWERRAQTIDWAVGQLLLSFPEYDPWLAAKNAAEGWDLRNKEP